MSEFIIVFREVLEASLVVGIIYLILEYFKSKNLENFRNNDLSKGLDDQYHTQKQMKDNYVSALDGYISRYNRQYYRWIYGSYSKRFFGQ